MRLLEYRIVGILTVCTYTSIRMGIIMLWDNYHDNGYILYYYKAI